MACLLLFIAAEDTHMRVAIPVWNGIISPVFDTAQFLTVYKCSSGVPVADHTSSIPPDPAGKLDCLVQNADVLICGAISQSLEHDLRERNIQVHPWVMGNGEDIVRAYICGQIGEYEYSMPGCAHRRRHGCGMRGRGCRNGRGNR